jgi:SAM-dependent methyltransferase
MNAFLNGVARAVAETFDLPEPILEIGSYQVEKQRDLANLRGLFPDCLYQGVDIRSGPGVDLVANVEDLPHLDGSVGTVLALSTFEHVRRFWRGFEEIRRVLRPSGAVLVSMPFHFPIHHFPCDYWRFTPQALEVLLEDYPSKIIGWHGPEDRPANVWALAFGPERPAITREQFQTFQTKLLQYGQMPLAPLRRWRFLLGRLLCGRRPFAPWLDRDRWQCRLLQQPAPMRNGDDARNATAAEGRHPGSVDLHCELELPRTAPRLSSLS